MLIFNGERSREESDCSPRPDKKWQCGAGVGTPPPVPSGTEGLFAPAGTKLEHLSEGANEVFPRDHERASGKLSWVARLRNIVKKRDFWGGGVSIRCHCHEDDAAIAGDTTCTGIALIGATC